jgi:hypothetical protein
MQHSERGKQVMPLYGTQPVGALYPGDIPFTVFAGEVLVQGSRSQQVGLAGLYENYPAGFSVSLEFSANPGAFEVDVLTSDVDTPDDYQLEANAQITSASGPGPNGKYIARVEFPTVRAMFALLSVKTAPANNPVTCLARIRR